MHQADILAQIGISIVAATIFAVVAKLLRQPLILGYMAAGVVIGPVQGLGWISRDQIEPISELGLILLLFMIGLEIDLKKLRESGPAVAATGITQFLLCVALGLVFFPLLGFHFVSGSYGPLYLAVATAMSSTMIVVKLLYDKMELDTVAGRITLGVLVFQDIWAILFLAIQPNLTRPSITVLLLSVVRGAALVAFALLMSRFVLPVLFRSIAKLPELMLIGALAWCFGISMLAGALGLSREMGALIAGVSISTFPYNLDVVAKVISLRDFFITLFFVTLGARIPMPTSSMLLLAVAASSFLVISRFVSVSPVLHAFKLGNRASVIPAINLAQISEFSLVICAIGVSMGHIGQSVLSLVVFTLVITSVTSTYGILYNDSIFAALNPVLKKVGVRDLGGKPEVTAAAQHKPIVFLGFFQDASALLHDLLAKDPGLAAQIAVIDFNPEVKKELDRRGILCLYGDISHADTLHHANIHDARVLICTITDSILKGTTNLRLLRHVRSLVRDGNAIVTAEHLSQARSLYLAGASYVYVPRFMSSRDLCRIVMEGLTNDLTDVRREALAHLQDRAEVLP